MYDNYSLYSGMVNEFSVLWLRFSFLKAGICTLIGLKKWNKNDKKTKQKQNQKQTKTKRSCQLFFAFYRCASYEIIFIIVSVYIFLSKLFSVWKVASLKSFYDSLSP